MVLEILSFVLVGFLAQLVDGALGMAYGVSSTTLLLTLGVTPAIASASVHTAEIFTTATSGLSHLKLGNVNRRLVTSLLLPGVLGGVIGAYLLTSLPVTFLKPAVSIYLAVMGVFILLRAVRPGSPEPDGEPRPMLLALAGGFLDAIGGGGWGPVVTSTLLARGHNPRFTIGSVNATEFFVTTAESAAFMLTLRAELLANWPTILGLLIGGVIAAPLAAVVCRKVPTRPLMGMVGMLIILLSVRTLWLAFAG